MSYVFKEVRYVRYLSFLPLLLIASPRIKKGYLTKIFGLFVPFIFFGVLLAAFANNFSYRLLADNILIIIPIVFVILLNSSEPINRNHIKCFFWVTVIFLFVEHYESLFVIIFSPSLIIEALITSSLDTESHFGFLLGLFFIYFIVTKSKKRYIFFSFIFLLLALKRIALLATFIAVVFYLFYRRKEFTNRFRKSINIIGFSLLIVIAFVLVHLSLGTYDEIIKEYTGFSANAFTKGRATMYKRALTNLPINFLGHGSGSVTDFLIGLKLETMNRLHSDFLRIFIELGWGFYSIWILVFNKVNIFNIKSISVLIFYWIIMATDNAFIYFDFLVLFYMIQSNLYDKQTS